MTLKVLLVDDDVKVHRTLTSLLEEYDVICCSSIKEAKCTLLFNMMSSFDVIICDELMPGGKGHELINWCNKNSINSKLIMLTGISNTKELSSKISDIDHVTIINKPWDNQQLINTINQ